MNRHGSAIIVTLGLIVTMAILATAFLAQMAQQRGIAQGTALQQRLRVAESQARALILADLLSETGYTSFTSDWHVNHRAIDDHGNPTWAFAMRGDSALGEGREYSRASGDPLDNMHGEPLHRWWGHLGSNHTWMLPLEQQWPKWCRAQRWVDVGYLDADMRFVEHPDQARYALRYSAEIMDQNGLRGVRPDWPGVPPAVDDSDLEFLRYRNYCMHYGRALRSMAGVSDSNTAAVARFPEQMPRSPYSPPWAEHFDQAGRARYTTEYAIPLPYHQPNDMRLRLELLFQGAGHNAIIWEPVSPYKHHVWLPNGFHIPAQISDSCDSASTGRSDLRGWESFTGRARGLRAAELGGSDTVSTPWAINLMTAAPAVLGQSIMGLNRRAFYSSSIDHCGRGYPEAFPLDHHEGRNIPLVESYDADGTWNERFDRPLLYSFSSHDIPVSQGARELVNRDDYMLDIIQAIDWAHVGFVNAFRDRRLANLDPLSHLDPDETDPDEILRQFVRDVLRVLGEVDIAEVGGLPTSRDGILSGRFREVGYGVKNRPLRIFAANHDYTERDWMARDIRPHKGFIEPGVNSRAMEYLLNDVLLSCFGYANPDFNDDAGSGRHQLAVDFNGDGMAESSLTGWWDGEATVWSWWWHGLGPTVALDGDLTDNTVHDLDGQGGADPTPDDRVPDWMQEETWYRFDRRVTGGVLRWNGSSWDRLVDIASSSEIDDFWQINDIFLNRAYNADGRALPGHAFAGNRSGPIKDFAHTGRLFVGFSRSFQVEFKTVCVDLTSTQTIAERLARILLHRDPNGDGNWSDAYTSGDWGTSIGRRSQ